MEPGLQRFVDRLQSEGRYTFAREEALNALEVTPDALRQAARRLLRSGRLVMPRRGFYVIVPLEHRAAGAPPPSWYVDALLRHANLAGYVGLLSAAALYGAAHQAPQVYQLVADRQVRPVTVGRSRLHFAFKHDAGQTPTVRRKTETGSMPVSTPEATALDLVRYVDSIGGLDVAATVLAELGEQLDPNALAEVAAGWPRTVGQRLGWLLVRVGHADRTAALHAYLESQAWESVDLQPGLVAEAEPDPHWRVRVARDVEVDE
jgi:predicted transcriptional regulator of viral defense system